MKSRSIQLKLRSIKEFRALMKLVNRRGGRIMLNALGAKQLDAVIVDLAAQAIRQNAPATKVQWPQ